MKSLTRHRTSLAAAALVVALPFVVITVGGPSQALDPVGLWDCSGPNCATSPIADPNNGAFVTKDDSVNVFVGGDMVVTGGAAESEGKTVVVGDFAFNRTDGNSRYDVGEAGVGSRITPNDLEDFFVVGGDIGVTDGQVVEAGANVPSIVRHAGAIVGVTGNAPDAGATAGTMSAGAGGGSAVLADANALSAYSNVAASLAATSTCLASLPATGSVAYSNVGTSDGTVTFTGTNAALEVFDMTGNLGLPSGAAGGINVSSISPTATIIINVTGGPAKYLNTFTGGFGGPLDAFREQVIWNIPTATDIDLTGNSQFQGSVLIGSAASDTVVTYPGMNGRFYTLGSVTHDGATGREFHNYPFTGSVAACEVTAPTTTTTIAETTTTVAATTTAADVTTTAAEVTTTVADDTTTTLAVADPTTELPATGRDGQQQLVLFALGLLALGVGAVLITRRRPMTW